MSSKSSLIKYFCPPNPFILLVPLRHLCSLFFRGAKRRMRIFLCNNAISDLFPSHRLVYTIRGKTKAVENPLSPDLMVPINICPRRLIDTHSLKLVEFDENTTIPRYAILSHRWFLAKEVVYAEFIQPREETFAKSGYQKIEAGCLQARKSNIRYLWVDTCCIDQGNPADVAANIMSMFAFYQNAEICYVYLPDVEEEKDMFGDWSKSFAGTDWFFRGWTLQEFIAPRTVIFFNRDWQRIGDKYELQSSLQWRTTVPPAILTGEQSILDTDVLTRMSWAIYRATTKPQDGAYCLQGLLGVEVEPDYDESLGNSFNRLGKALFAAHPGLQERMEVNDDLLNNPNSFAFYQTVVDRFTNVQRGIQVVGET